MILKSHTNGFQFLFWFAGIRKRHAGNLCDVMFGETIDQCIDWALIIVGRTMVVVVGLIGCWGLCREAFIV